MCLLFFLLCIIAAPSAVWQPLQQLSSEELPLHCMYPPPSPAVMKPAHASFTPCNAHTAVMCLRFSHSPNTVSQTSGCRACLMVCKESDLWRYTRIQGHSGADRQLKWMSVYSLASFLTCSLLCSYVLNMLSLLHVIWNNLTLAVEIKAMLKVAVCRI